MRVSMVRRRAAIIPITLLAMLLGASGVAAAEAPASEAATVTVDGTGVLAAKGDGHTRLAGSYVLIGSLDGGTLEIRGIDRFSRIRISGWLSKTRLVDGTVVYRFGERTGQYVISGRTIATNIVSDALRFTATGHGRATLRGEGTYWVNGRGPLPWSDPAPEAVF